MKKGRAIAPPEYLTLPASPDSPDSPGSGKAELQVTLYRDYHRTIRIAVRPDQTVVIKVPASVKSGEALRALASKRSWIEAKLAMFRALPQKAEHAYQDGENFLYLGKAFALRLDETPTKGSIRPRLPVVTLQQGILSVTGSALTPERTAKAIALWRCAVSRKLLTRRLARLHRQSCARLGDSPPLPKLKLRAFTRRWGSCSLGGDITLAVTLSALPLRLVDYVILHELCHLRRFDHSKAFHALLASIMPDYLLREKEIRNFRLDMVKD